MLKEDHIFTIKTKDPENVASIQTGERDIVISGLNVLKDQIRIGDFVFVVFGGDKPKDWTPGLVGLAHISRAPFDEGYEGRNFRVGIDVDVYFEPSVARSDLVSYPDTFGIIGIAPITKWEPNQAITSVDCSKAIALIQAICELRPHVVENVRTLLGETFDLVAKDVKRYVVSMQPFGKACLVDLRPEFIKWAPFKKPVRGKSASEETIGKYSQYLGCFEAPMAVEGKACGSGWNGVIEFICGRRQRKEFYQIDNVPEFDNEFGIVKRIFNGEPCPDDAIKENYDKVLAWASTPYFRKHACFESAYDAYREFLDWHEKRTKELPVAEPRNVDRLTVALKLFREARKGGSANPNVTCWTYSPGEQAGNSDEDFRDGTMALDWHELNRTLTDFASQEDIRKALQTIAGDEASHKNGVLALWEFCNEMKLGDLIFAKKGIRKFIAVGRVTGEYEFHSEKQHFQHVRKVDWFKIEGLESEDAAALKTLTDVTGSGLAQKLCEAYGVALGASNDGGWFHEGRSVNGRIREYFDSLTEEKIRAFSDEDLKEFFCHSETDPATHVVFEHMWSGKNGQGWGNIKPSSMDELKEAADYLVGVRRDVSVAATFLQKGAKHPKGFGPSVVSELLMKFHPESCFKHGSVSRNVLKHLGLVDFASEKSDYDEDEYKLVCGAAALILGKMKAMKIARQINADGSEDTAKPDYLTVNEFIWFVNENKDLIKEKVMESKMKKPNIAIKAGTKTLGALIGQDPDSMMSRLTAALLTKPFAILAGASGTGKSRMVRQLAYMTCLNTDLQDEAKDATAPGNYRLVQVKPNWHDSSDLLGYRSAINEGTYVTTDFVKFVLKAHAYPDTPFFICLDEMNLAPVEQYFAEFLSASEDVKKADDGKTLVSAALIKPSDFGGDVLNLEPEYELAADRKALIEKIGLFIPHNLYVVGTVNMDDTTCQFSRKVLDRAMTIEMNEVKLETLQKKDVMTFDDLLLTEPEIKLFTERAEFDGTKLDDPFRDKLDSLRGDLESSPFAIAYRFAREAVMYREAIAQIGNDTAKAAKDEIALDHMSLMKILPRITGTTTERKGVTDKLTAFFSGLGRPLSLKKLNEMIAAALGNGDYLSFWP